MSTLADVTKRLEEINSDGVRQRDDIVAGLELVAETIQNAGMSQEQVLENARHQAKMLELLEGIKNGQKGGKGGDGGDAGDGGNIGLMGGLLGAALGGLVGAIMGYVKAWKTMMKAIMPNKLIEVANKTMSSITNFFRSIGDRFGSFVKRIADIFKSDGPVGKVAGFLGRLGDTIADFFKPITEAVSKMKGTGQGISKIFAPITNGIKSFFGFFGRIGSSLSGFTTMFKAVAGVMSKIFYPLTIILTLWDTVKGAIAGFMENGIIGGIAGAIEGFFTSLVTVPLDMIKGAIAWVADMLGFDKAAEFLNSFSFTDLFKGMMDSVVDFIKGIPDIVVNAFNASVEYVGGLFSEIGTWFSDNLITPISEAFTTYVKDPIMGAFEFIGGILNDYLIEPISSAFTAMRDWFGSIFDPVISFLEDFGIPEISWDLPVIGKVGIGPWYPFRGEGSDTGSSHVSSEDSITTETMEGSDGSFESTQASNSYIKSVGSHFDATGDETVLTDDVTSIMVNSMNERETNDGSSFAANSAFLEFNTRTGESSYNGESVSKGVYRAGKRAAETGGTADDVELAMARAAAYDQLSWWNAAKALAGSDPIELLAEQEGKSFSVADLVPGAGAGAESGSTINNDSVAIADANRDAQTAGGNTNVVAPTTNNVNNQTVAGPRRSARNQDPTANLAFSPVG